MDTLWSEIATEATYHLVEGTMKTDDTWTGHGRRHAPNVRTGLIVAPDRESAIAALTSANG